MVTESGLKLRTRLESAKTLLATTGAEETVSAGEMTVVGDTIGVVVEDAGTSSPFVLVYEAEKILVPKATGVSIAVGGKVYFDAAEKNVTSTATDNTLCGRALAAVASAETEALIDLMVMS
jgi:predicted RecA/RadA family phage recombinase